MEQTEVTTTKKRTTSAIPQTTTTEWSNTTIPTLEQAQSMFTQVKIAYLHDPILVAGKIANLKQLDDRLAGLKMYYWPNNGILCYIKGAVTMVQHYKNLIF